MVVNSIVVVQMNYGQKLMSCKGKYVSNKHQDV